MSRLSSWPAAVAGAAMTVHTLDRVFSSGAASPNVVHEIRVAPQTILLQRLGVPRRDHDGLMEVHEREALGMPVAVVGLGQVLRDELMRQMTVDAPGQRMVRPATPRRVLLVH